MRHLCLLLLLTGLILCGCPADDDDADDDDVAGDDDSAAGDDDTAGDDDVDPGTAPVVSALTLSHSGDSELCYALVAWHAEDVDGDLVQTQVFAHFPPEPVFTWNMSVPVDPPLTTQDFSLEVRVGQAPAIPTLDPGEVYDVELWQVDTAGNESNHLLQEGWQAPDEDCM